MEVSQSPKIPFYVQRPFGEKMNAAFDFIKENWKVMFKYITYLILPVCLVQALTMNAFMDSYMEILADGYAPDSFKVISTYGFTALLSTIGSLLIVSLIYALVRLYNEREERLAGIKFHHIKPLLFRNMGRLFLLGLLAGVFFVLAILFTGFLVAATPLTLIVTIPLLIACAVALLMWTPIYLFENIGLGASFSKAFRMGFATWGGVFAVAFIMGLIASVLQGVLTTPWYILVGVKSVLSYSSEIGNSPSFLLNAMLYVLGVIQVFGAYLSTTFVILGLSYQYSHASEKLDNVTVESEIDNFENL